MNPSTFRCKHRHSGISHPICYARYIAGEASIIKRTHTFRSSKILLWDVETLPGEWYSFSPKTEYLPHVAQIKPVSMSCWAAKWLFDDTIMGDVVTAEEAKNRKDKRIIESLWKLLEDADIVITHNGRNFDIPMFWTRLIDNKISPPKKFQNVDTYKVAKQVFKFEYNSLDALGERFGIGKKLDMSFLDWKNCLQPSDTESNKALKHMLEYCKKDIAPLLEDVYLEMLPYIPNHPNLGLWSYNSNDVCRNCESSDIVWDGKLYATPKGIWDSWRCNSCGAVGRGEGKDHKLLDSPIKVS